MDTKYARINQDLKTASRFARREAAQALRLAARIERALAERDAYEIPVSNKEVMDNVYSSRAIEDESHRQRRHDEYMFQNEREHTMAFPVLIAQRRRAVLDDKGNPKRDENGKIVHETIPIFEHIITGRGYDRLKDRPKGRNRNKLVVVEPATHPKGEPVTIKQKFQSKFNTQ